MRAATRKRGWYERRGIGWVGADVLMHRFEMQRRKDMRHINRQALAEYRMELADWMIQTPGLPDDVAEVKVKVLDKVVRVARRAGRYMDQQRHGTTGKLIPCKKEWPDDYEADDTQDTEG